MAPQRPRLIPEDSRSEASSTREKQTSTLPTASVPKGRRIGNFAVTIGSNLKDVTAAPTVATGQQSPSDSAGGINWSDFDLSVLQAYRHAYRLNTPSAFNSPYNQMILTNPGIGRCSPTMARHKDRRRVSKEHLALAVRKDFNAAMIHEPEVLTSFLYVTDNQDKNFRMRFAPSKPK